MILQLPESSFLLLTFLLQLIEQSESCYPIDHALELKKSRILPPCTLPHFAVYSHIVNIVKKKIAFLIKCKITGGGFKELGKMKRRECMFFLMDAILFTILNVKQKHSTYIFKQIHVVQFLRIFSGAIL